MSLKIKLIIMMMIRDIITNLSVPFYNAEIMGIGRELEDGRC